MFKLLLYVFQIYIMKTTLFSSRLWHEFHGKFDSNHNGLFSYDWNICEYMSHHVSKTLKKHMTVIF